MAVLAMVRVQSLVDHTIAEEFPFYGRVELASGETRRVPVDVAQNWADVERNGRVLVEILDEIDMDAGLLSPVAAVTNKGKK